MAKRDNEYERRGTANIFGIVEPKAGRHFTCATPNRSAAAFAQRIHTVVTAYSGTSTIHLVLDNLDIHCEKSLTDYSGKRSGRRPWRRLSVHYTPTHGSWLNQAEIELSLVARRCLGSQRMPTLRQLRAQTGARNRRATRRQTRINWRSTRKGARRKFAYISNLSKRSET